MKIMQLCQEDNGNYSSTRLVFMLWAIGTLLVWSYMSIKLGSLQVIDSSHTMILAIFMTGKVVQKYGEKPGLTETKTP